MKKTYNDVTRTIEFSFADGVDPLSVNPLDYPVAVQQYAAIHGFLSKLGDAAALTKDASNSFIVTEAMRRAAVVAMHQQLLVEGWNAKTRTAKPDAAILAIMGKRGCTAEEALAWLNAKLMAELE